MCDEGMRRGREHGGMTIDVQRTMREIQKRIAAANQAIEDPSKHTGLHVADGVHLNELGQVAMAYAILKGLGARADVSSATIDSASADVVESTGCAISGIATKGSRLEFVRLDEGLPLNGETFFALHFRFVPIHNELNRYMLSVTGLPDGRYDVSADGRKVATFTSRQLAAGVNISSSTPDPWLPGGPWMAQANVLQSLTEARDKLDMARLLAGWHLQGRELPEQLGPEVRAGNEELEAMQRLVARPRPYRFVVEPASE
jgi:hypothetical protein